MPKAGETPKGGALFPTMAPVFGLGAGSELAEKLVREVDWHRDTPRFNGVAELAGAVVSGSLVELKDDDNIRLIARFTPDMDQAQPGFWPYLTPGALLVAQEFGRLWRHILATEFGVERPDVRLPITSLVRTVPYQMDLVAGGRFASPDSTHMTGWAFDTDNGSYYKQQEDGLWVSCAHPGGRGQRKDAAEAIRQRYGMDPEAKLFRQVFDREYDPRINEAGYMAAKILHDKEVTNLVLEFPGQPYSVLHQGVNPGILADAD